MELDFAKIEQYTKSYRNWLKEVPGVYDYDNCQCCCFAHLLSGLAEKDGYQTSKVCALASKRDIETDKVSAFMPQADKDDFVEVKWDYHMAFAIEVPVYKDSPKTELLVADPVLFGKNLVSLKQWKQSLACPDYAFIQARRGLPIQGSPRGYWLSADEPKDLDAHAKQELQSLEQRVKRQQVLENAVKTNPQLQKEIDNDYIPHYRPLTSLLAYGLQKSQQAFNKKQIVKE